MDKPKIVKLESKEQTPDVSKFFERIQKECVEMGVTDALVILKAGDTFSAYVTDQLPYADINLMLDITKQETLLSMMQE